MIIGRVYLHLFNRTHSMRQISATSHCQEYADKPETRLGVHLTLRWSAQWSRFEHQGFQSLGAANSRVQPSHTCSHARSCWSLLGPALQFAAMCSKQHHYLSRCFEIVFLVFTHFSHPSCRWPCPVWQQTLKHFGMGTASTGLTGPAVGTGKREGEVATLRCYTGSPAITMSEIIVGDCVMARLETLECRSG